MPELRKNKSMVHQYDNKYKKIKICYINIEVVCGVQAWVSELFAEIQGLKFGQSCIFWCWIKCLIEIKKILLLIPDISGNTFFKVQLNFFEYGPYFPILDSESPFYSRFYDVCNLIKMRFYVFLVLIKIILFIWMCT